ncbi:hypothetical protein NCS57_01327200 [Fusarium keratoplasticum]|uniref:Uncharacterized protein n=1 Tax=Fusarium keratoplasticum TaxID=1328300 RepID=A0ACC0QFP2_9HYPO|nr:hypothetical protein NCS57_01327200 [Fusarium keratoplasticum]KAI8652626.1 hypothetical protein NCS57_01327200 [Fusarium keratoplasticum]
MDHKLSGDDVDRHSAVKRESISPGVRRESISPGKDQHVTADSMKLMSMGYEPQMKRELNTLQLVGVAFMVTASWLGVTGGFSTGVLIGGSAAIVYGLILIGVMNIFIVTTLAELMSAMPNAGGQYYWVTQLAPPSVTRPSAFFTGLCNLFGGIVATSGGFVLMGHLVLGCVKLVHPSFTIHSWQAYLVGLAFNTSIFIVNLNYKSISTGLTIGMVVNILACAAITISIPAVSATHTDASYIFDSLENISGWKSKGMAFLVGLINANYSYGMIDTAVHMAEEIPDPEKNVPKALYMTVGLGFLTAWPLAVLLMWCLTDFNGIVGTETGVPLLQLFYLALRKNKAAAIFMLSLIMASYFFAVIGLQAYMSRICWAFSRDNGLPFSKLWSRVHPRLNIPLEAHVLCTVLVSLLSLLGIASTTAFNSLAAGVVIFPSLSYSLPAFYSLFPKNKDVKGPFNLGRLGTFCRVATVLFSIFSTVIYSFPYMMPATADNMNYISPILGVFLLYAVADWFLRARKSFIVREH